MPHTPQAKKKAIARLRRIQGQAQALERAIEAGSPCGPVLQQLAALRGAVNGLTHEVITSHLRETFGGSSPEDAQPSHPNADLEDTIALIRSYLK